MQSAVYLLETVSKFGPIEHGYRELERALRHRGYAVYRVDSLPEKGDGVAIVAAVSTEIGSLPPPVSKKIISGAMEPPAGKEAMSVDWIDVGGTPCLVVLGSDAVGLMYALTEISQMLVGENLSLREIPAWRESPSVPVRGIFTFLHNADLEREWFYSRQYWREYFKMLARYRYNSFNLVFSHQTYYLAPMFPFFIEVPEHPEVKAIDLSPAEQKRNLETLRMISETAASYGIDFVLGIWQVCSWKKGVFGGGDQVRTMVQGLDDENLESYTYYALHRLLEACPAIKGVQVRVNTESGVPESIQTEFFRNTVFRAIQDTGGRVHLDLRCWLAKPETIQAALDMGIPLSLSMKYWAEHQGGPYQAPVQLPAYSYADFLHYPLRAPVMYQMWGLGSHRILLWGDPDYGRRFAESMQLGPARGFEVNPPLAQKGYGNEPGYWRILADRELEHYHWEFERYWFYYLVFGRTGYNPSAHPRVWQRELRARFGDLAEQMEELYRTASKVISFLIRYQMSDPNMYTWPEIDTGGVLDYYMQTPPSDPALMESICEAALARLNGRNSARMTPSEASATFEEIGTKILELVREISSAAKEPSKELKASLIDFSISGRMALYHAAKIRSAESLALYYHTKDRSALSDAKAFMQKAAAIWDECVSLADGFFEDHMVTGPIDSGHWKAKKVLNDDDLARLDQLVELYENFAPFDYAFDFGETPPYRSRENLPFAIHQDYHIERHFNPVTPGMRYQPRTGYGWEGGVLVRGIAHEPVRLSDRDLDTKRRDTGREFEERLAGYHNALYSDAVWGLAPAAFLVDVPDGRYRVSVVIGTTADAFEVGPMFVQVNGQLVVSNVCLPKGRVAIETVEVEVSGGRVRLDVWAEPGSKWCLAGLVINRIGVYMSHVPPLVCTPEKPPVLRVSVRSVAAQVETVRARFGDRELPLQAVREGVYEAPVPVEWLTPGATLEYALEVTDSEGRAWNRSKDRPDGYRYTLRVVESDAPPVIEPISSLEASSRVTNEGHLVQVRVKGGSRVRVRLYYRHVNQYYVFQVKEMVPSADEEDGWIRYQATIPAEYFDDRWDVMYYVEAVDEAGNGCYWPDPDQAVPYVVIPVGRRDGPTLMPSRALKRCGASRE